jgi:hypothetical protein
MCEDSKPSILKNLLDWQNEGIFQLSSKKKIVVVALLVLKIQRGYLILCFIGRMTQVFQLYKP